MPKRNLNETKGKRIVTGGAVGRGEGLGTYASQQIGQLVGVQRCELPDLSRCFVPSRWSGACLQQTQQPVESTTPALLAGRHGGIVALKWFLTTLTTLVA